ncbi:MAG: hypothetical protein M3Q98_16490 [Actinomycetota bacterium]|nr:hypothetical protein [Actinomycetota bacterium]
MKTKSLRATAGIGLMVAAVAALGWAAPAQAAGDSDVATTSVSAPKQAATNKYWTPQRLRNAVPGDALMLGRSLEEVVGKVTAGLPKIVMGTQASGPLGLGLGSLLGDSAFAGGYYSGGGQVVKTTGKVFFTLGGANYQCSGSSVKAKNNDLVLTAGHCLNEGPGAFATNFVFIPGYKDGAALYGKFPARKLTTTTRWKNQGDLNYDVGMAVVSRLGKTHLAQKVGAQGIAFNQPRGKVMYSFGYPAASPYNGNSIAWCHAQVADDSVGGSSDQGMKCNMTGGSSGGPWYLGYNEKSGAGLANSVNSFKYQTLLFEGDTMFGPYFGSVTQSLYKTAQGL